MKIGRVVWELWVSKIAYPI